MDEDLDPLDFSDEEGLEGGEGDLLRRWRCLPLSSFPPRGEIEPALLLGRRLLDARTGERGTRLLRGAPSEEFSSRSLVLVSRGKDACVGDRALSSVNGINTISSFYAIRIPIIIACPIVTIAKTLPFINMD